MRLAALYTGIDEESALHLELEEGYASVDEIARHEGVEKLAGLRDVAELFALGEDALEDLRALEVYATPTLGSRELRLAPPVRRPSKIVCVGLNYLAHIEESRREIPDRIVLFSKYASCLVAHGDDVVIPSITQEVDYEGELAVIIGKRASRVGISDAMNYVGGYSVINDVSARDLQNAELQWIRGKALDTFAPLGPVVVDAKSSPSIAELRIRTTVNGEVRQDASCSQMITSVPSLISYISQAITLEPGDIIATGTPSGVAFGMNPPVYLKPGDSMTVEINGIGKLSNRLVAG